MQNLKSVTLIRKVIFLPMSFYVVAPPTPLPSTTEKPYSGQERMNSQVLEHHFLFRRNLTLLRTHVVISPSLVLCQRLRFGGSD